MKFPQEQGNIIRQLRALNEFTKSMIIGYLTDRKGAILE
jgi:hypothetical protein